MTPDKATVELVAKAICAAQEGGSYCSDKCADCVPDAVDGGEIMVLAEAAVAALPTPTAASGLVEALEKIISLVPKLQLTACHIDQCNDRANFHRAIDSAREALAQHRAGNPWRDVVPTEPGEYRWKPKTSTLSALVEIMCPPDGRLFAGTRNSEKMGAHYGVVTGFLFYLDETPEDSQWCKATPPEGS